MRRFKEYVLESSKGIKEINEIISNLSEDIASEEYLYEVGNDEVEIFEYNNEDRGLILVNGKIIVDYNFEMGKGVSKINKLNDYKTLVKIDELIKKGNYKTADFEGYEA